MRYILVGYRKDIGYGVKDLQDGIVEYFDKKSLIATSKIVKIYGVENEKIDLDWFRAYYARCLISLGEDETVSKTGLKLYNNILLPLVNLKNMCFIEFIEDLHELTFKPFTQMGEVYARMIDLDSVSKELAGNNSTLFHLRHNVFLGRNVLSGSVINKINVRNIVRGNQEIHFVSNSDIAVHDLKMCNCIYRLVCSKNCYLIRVPDSVRINLHLRWSSGCVVIGKYFNIDNLANSSPVSPPKVYYESGVDLVKLRRIFGSADYTQVCIDYSETAEWRKL